MFGNLGAIEGAPPYGVSGKCSHFDPSFSTAKVCQRELEHGFKIPSNISVIGRTHQGKTYTMSHILADPANFRHRIGTDGKSTFFKDKVFKRIIFITPSYEQNRENWERLRENFYGNINEDWILFNTHTLRPTTVVCLMKSLLQPHKGFMERIFQEKAASVFNKPVVGHVKRIGQEYVEISNLTQPSQAKHRVLPLDEWESSVLRGQDILRREQPGNVPPTNVYNTQNVAVVGGGKNVGYLCADPALKPTTMSSHRNQTGEEKILDNLMLSNNNKKQSQLRNDVSETKMFPYDGPPLNHNLVDPDTQQLLILDDLIFDQSTNGAMTQLACVTGHHYNLTIVRLTQVVKPRDADFLSNSPYIIAQSRDGNTVPEAVRQSLRYGSSSAPSEAAKRSLNASLDRALQAAHASQGLPFIVIDQMQQPELPPEDRPGGVNAYLERRPLFTAFASGFVSKKTEDSLRIDHLLKVDKPTCELLAVEGIISARSKRWNNESTTNRRRHRASNKEEDTSGDPDEKLLKKRKRENTTASEKTVRSSNNSANKTTKTSAAENDTVEKNCSNESRGNEYPFESIGSCGGHSTGNTDAVVPSTQHTKSIEQQQPCKSWTHDTSVAST